MITRPIYFEYYSTIRPYWGPPPIKDRILRFRCGNLPALQTILWLRTMWIPEGQGQTIQSPPIQSPPSPPPPAAHSTRRPRFSRPDRHPVPGCRLTLLSYACCPVICHIIHDAVLLKIPSPKLSCTNTPYTTKPPPKREMVYQNWCGWDGGFEPPGILRLQDLKPLFR